MMRAMVKTEVCDQPSVQYDCHARRPVSELVRLDQCLDYNLLIAFVLCIWSRDTLMHSKKARCHSYRRMASPQTASPENKNRNGRIGRIWFKKLRIEEPKDFKFVESLIPFCNYSDDYIPAFPGRMKWDELQEKNAISTYLELPKPRGTVREHQRAESLDWRVPYHCGIYHLYHHKAQRSPMKEKVCRCAPVTKYLVNAFDWQMFKTTPEMIFSRRWTLTLHRRSILSVRIQLVDGGINEGYGRNSSDRWVPRTLRFIPLFG